MTRIASHRGGTLEFGDSTPRGFRATASMPLEEVEFDLHPTRDGAIMIHHDATLDRTTDLKGAIADLTEADVRRATIDYSGGAHPISLQELCEIYLPSAVDFRCEIKPDHNGIAYRGFVPQVIGVLRDHGMLERTTFSSFLLETLEELRTATKQPCLWLVSPPVLRQLGSKVVADLACAKSIPEVGVHIDYADQESMAVFQAAALEFGCWAAHRVEQIEKALGLGVKVFTTDRPSLAVALRKAKSREHAA